MVDMDTKVAADKFQKAYYVSTRTKGRQRAAAERTLQRYYKQAWNERRESVRTSVLVFLRQLSPEDGKDIILAGLRSRKILLFLKYWPLQMKR